MRVVGPSFSVVLRLRGGVVAEAARPVSYMTGWQVARVLALAERWSWRVELSDAERAQIEQESRGTDPPQQPAA